jgi:hypothetical protein
VLNVVVVALDVPSEVAYTVVNEVVVPKVVVVLNVVVVALEVPREVAKIVLYNITKVVVVLNVVVVSNVVVVDLEVAVPLEVERDSAVVLEVAVAREVERVVSLEARPVHSRDHAPPSSTHGPQVNPCDIFVFLAPLHAAKLKYRSKLVVVNTVPYVVLNVVVVLNTVVVS